MKIHVVETLIEADANELRASQTLGQNVAALLSRCFESQISGRYEPEEDEEDGQEEA